MIAKYTAKISGTGNYVPEKIVNNHDLEKIVDTSDAWIRSMTGMWERHFVADDQASSDMATFAAENAIKAAGLKAKDIDMIVVGTISPDHAFPSTACIVQKNLGVKNFPAFDISAGCTGFIYAADIARQYVENGIAKHCIAIGVETLSRLINWDDRGTCVLFGDGAGAIVVSRAESTDIANFIDSALFSDGSQGDLLIQPAGGSREPASVETVHAHKHTVHMEGNKIFKHAVKSMYAACDTILKRNHLDIKSVDWLIPHQANMRIIDSLGKKLRIDPKKVVVTIEKYANTSSSTVPIALDDAIKSKQIRHGDLVLLVAFGAGLTSGAALLRI